MKSTWGAWTQEENVLHANMDKGPARDHYKNYSEQEV